MTKQLLISACFALLLGSIPLGLLGNIAYAKEANATQRRADAAEENAQNDDKGTEASDQRSENAANKDKPFTIQQQRACNKNQDNIKARMQQISDRGATQLAVFKKIADRTKSFYAAKGYNASGYSQAAADVDTAYDQASVALGTTQASQREWSCATADPQATMVQFRDAKQHESTVLMEYKEKVRALILIVKQAGVSR